MNEARRGAANDPGAMRMRLRLLLVNFNRSIADYALARLEVALANPVAPAPPVIDRLGSSARGDDEFNARWPAALMQVGAAEDFVAAVERGELGIAQDLTWARLARAVKLIGRFAESIEWIGA